MIVDKAWGLRAAVTVVDANKSSVRTRIKCLNLALILEKIVGLNNRHWEFAEEVVTRVFVPEESILFPCWRRRRRPETSSFINVVNILPPFITSGKTLFLFLHIRQKGKQDYSEQRVKLVINWERLREKKIKTLWSWWNGYLRLEQKQMLRGASQTQTWSQSTAILMMELKSLKLYKCWRSERIEGKIEREMDPNQMRWREPLSTASNQTIQSQLSLLTGIRLSKLNPFLFLIFWLFCPFWLC